MKKSLLALAALTAFAGVASAQSSVTLFGVVDLAATNVDADTQKTLMTTDGNSSSRLGFRGVEDLGGGLKAGFWLEGALSADDGSQVRLVDVTNPITGVVTTRGTVVGSQTWQRRSTISLMGGFGEVRLGRDYTPTFWNWTIFDPFGTVGVGSATNLGLEAAGIVPGGSYGTLVRADNTFGYFLPSGLGGFYGQAMVTLGEGSAGNKYYGGRLGWASGPFNIAAAYGQTEVTLGDMDGSNWNIAGSWNLGMVRLSGFYGMIAVDGNRFEQENWFVAATVPFGAMSLKGSYGSVDRSRGLNQGDAEQWALGVQYDLSKRTAVYGTYSSIDNSGGAVFGVSSSRNAPTVSRGTDPTGYQVGVRHSF
jgi:predicted porin